MSSNQPNATLYLNNLNDKVNKEELRLQLFALFTTYGKIIDVIASKGSKMRGQAFLVFTDLASATSAMRACEGMIFYEKPLHIDYAKAKSYATLKREDPNFIQPNAVHTNTFVNGATDRKRGRDEEATDGERQAKRDKTEDDDDDGEEMEIDEEDEQPPVEFLAVDGMPPISQVPSARLLCTNLPQEVTDGVLGVLFQQYSGFRRTMVVQSPIPNDAGEQVKMAQVLFDSTQLAIEAKNGLDGFSLKKGWLMSVAFI
ncbi:RNA-binding domain-containing protein [Mycena floridula]|nr:RNA-binding domain-containing protein [Mycena floridula]